MKNQVLVFLPKNFLIILLLVVLPFAAAAKADEFQAVNLVEILIEMLDLSTKESPEEKFERTFKTKLIWDANSESKLPATYSGSSLNNEVLINGSARQLDAIVVRYTARMQFSSTGQCVLVSDLRPFLPKLTRSLHGGPAIFRDDAPDEWEFYESYSFENNLGRGVLYFAYGINSDRIQPSHKQCLREQIILQNANK